MSTICRFVFGYLKFPGSLKLTVLITAQVVTGVVCSLLGLCNFPNFAAYFCSIFYGASMSLIFPLFLSVSKEFNIHFSDSQVSNMLISLTLAGLVSSLTGELMKISLNMLFYSVLAYGVVLFITGRMTLETLRKESALGEEKGVEIPFIQK
jgi:hypothetical protein